MPPHVVASDHHAAATQRFHEAYLYLYDAVLKVPSADLDEVVDAETRLDDSVRDKLREITDIGAAHAREAIRREPDRAANHLLLAVHLSLGGFCRSATRNFFEGTAARIRDAYTKSRQLDPRFAAGGAWRLEGKYFLSTPWPLRDLDRAERALRAAERVQVVPQSRLFWGDLRYKQGKREEAIRAWEEALRVPSDQDLLFAQDRIRELARQRLQRVR